MPDTTPPPVPLGASTAAGMSLFGGPGGAHAGSGAAGDGDAGSLCSRKGCRDAATAVLLWNNPRIHTPERRKAWASCPEHIEWFEQYLGDRGLWRETRALADPAPPNSTRVPSSAREEE